MFKGTKYKIRFILIFAEVSTKLSTHKSLKYIYKISI